MSEKLSERMNASITLAMRSGRPITLSEAKDWREDVLVFEASLAQVQADVEALRAAFAAAEQRQLRGISPKQMSFRCSHCGEVTPLLLDGLLLALRDAAPERLKDQPK